MSYEVLTRAEPLSSDDVMLATAQLAHIVAQIDPRIDEAKAREKLKLREMLTFVLRRQSLVRVSLRNREVVFVSDGKTPDRRRRRRRLTHDHGGLI